MKGLPDPSIVVGWAAVWNRAVCKGLNKCSAEMGSQLADDLERPRLLSEKMSSFPWCTCRAVGSVHFMERLFHPFGLSYGLVGWA
jgi:hypothetical protein